VLFPHDPEDTAAHIFRQIQAFRHSDEALQHMPCLVILDGFDDLAADPVSLRAALRAARHMAQSSSTTIWLGAVGDSGATPDMVDVHMKLIVGEPAVRSWIDQVPEWETDRVVSAAVLPRLYPEAAQGRLPCVLRSISPHGGWCSHAYHLYYPTSGRFQNIVPKKES